MKGAGINYIYFLNYFGADAEGPRRSARPTALLHPLVFTFVPKEGKSNLLIDPDARHWVPRSGLRVAGGASGRPPAPPAPQSCFICVSLRPVVTFAVFLQAFGPFCCFQQFQLEDFNSF